MLLRAVIPAGNHAASVLLLPELCCLRVKQLPPKRHPCLAPDHSPTVIRRCRVMVGWKPCTRACWCFKARRCAPSLAGCGFAAILPVKLAFIGKLHTQDCQYCRTWRCRRRRHPLLPYCCRRRLPRRSARRRDRWIFRRWWRPGCAGSRWFSGRVSMPVCTARPDVCPMRRPCTG
jgi:hypothetical protein